MTGQTALAMLAVLALIGLFFRFLGFLRNRFSGGSRARIEVLEANRLGDKRQLLLVRVDGRLLLVGSTPERISPLLELVSPGRKVCSVGQSPTPPHGWGVKRVHVSGV